MHKWPLCFFMILCTACHSSSADQNSRIKIQLSKDSQIVYIGGIEYSVLQEVKKDTLSLESWQGIFPVYRMPADTDMADLQPEQPGTYQITDSLIIFKPDTAFQKHHQYFARFYGDGSNFSTTNLIRGRSNLKGQNFTEVRFKF